MKHICISEDSNILVISCLYNNMLFSVTKSCLTLCKSMNYSMPGFSLSFTVFQSLFKLMSIESVILAYHLFLCHPLLLLPSIFPSIRVFSNELVLIRWPKYWGFSFSINPSNEYSGLISFRIHWFDLLAVQGTLKSLLEKHNSKESILLLALCLFCGPPPYPYTTTGKIIALTIWTFVGKVKSLLLNILSRFVIALLPISKCLIILWLQSPSAMILQPKKIKSVILYTLSSSTKWSRAKVNRVFPRECTGHSKHSLPRKCYRSANCVTHTVKQRTCMECLSGFPLVVKFYTGQDWKCILWTIPSVLSWIISPLKYCKIISLQLK